MIDDTVFCTNAPRLPKTGDSVSNCLHCMLSEVGGEGQEPRRRERGQESEAGRRREEGSQGRRKREEKREMREEACGQTDAVVFALLCRGML